MINECGECFQNGGWGNVVPDVVGAELHHDDVRLGYCEPPWKLVIRDNSRGKVAPMAVVLAVIRETAALTREGANKVSISYAGGL